MNLTVATAEVQTRTEKAIISELVKKAHVAMEAFANADQPRTDEAVTALAWAIYEPERDRELAEIAVKDTGIGNVKSKIIKNKPTEEALFGAYLKKYGQ